MARDYAKKLAAMRAYGQSPEGKAKRKKYLAQKREKQAVARVDPWKVNPVPLVNAIANWGKT